MAQNDEIILININGADRPGVTAALTEILAQKHAGILRNCKRILTSNS